ncbi:DNA topoisomerase 3 [Marinobacter sp.]|uniref:DNA topoisomerase 3 n=1 Tax=Marinobacter sp. TaxID=50741 RepID=UPI00356351E5
MDLYLCEKPKVGRAVASILKATDRKEGYATDGGQIYVTWAIGHLLEVFEPGEYDEKWKRWNVEHLPILPTQWQMKVKHSVRKQYEVVEKLLKKATKVYIATDIDREGEAIARELMDRAGYWGTTYRVPIASLDPVSIRDALNNIRPGEETYNLYMAQIGRTHADWLIGMNFSRLTSLTAQAAGSRESLPVGRVLTAIVALVAYHDERRKSFVPHDYFTIDVVGDFATGRLKASWIPPRSLTDDNGRCIDQAFAQKLAVQLKSAPITVADVKTRETSKKAPLPFDMTSLQQYCSNRWGYSASKTLKAAQELYETHTLITYPRSDCKYLPDSQFPQVQSIFDALVEGDQSLADKVALADSSKKPLTYNTSKVGAHHAIIPTTKSADFKSLPEAERNVFDAVRLRFIAQFCEPQVAKVTKINLESAGHKFLASGSIPVSPGWTAVYGNDPEACDPKDDKDEDEDDADKQQLPHLEAGDQGTVADASLQSKKTQPPKPFTDSTLLGAMNNVSRFVDEPELKKILDEKDGIGTQATRAGILDNAFRYGYLERKKKQIIATDKAYGMLKLVPPALASPGMTAGWEKQLDKIAAGELSLEEFEQKIVNWMTKLVAVGKEKIASNDLGSAATDFAEKAEESNYKCFECGSALKRIRGKNGHFWGCQERDKCGATFPDAKGKPKQREKQPDNAPECPDCGKTMRLRTAKKAKGKGKGLSKFWGCSGFPECKSTMELES